MASRTGGDARAAAAAGRPTVANIAKLASSNDRDDRATAAVFFMELATSRGCGIDIVNDPDALSALLDMARHSLSLHRGGRHESLTRMSDSDVSSTTVHALQALALLARSRTNYATLVQWQVPDLLFSHIIACLGKVENQQRQGFEQVAAAGASPLKGLVRRGAGQILEAALAGLTHLAQHGLRNIPVATLEPIFRLLERGQEQPRHTSVTGTEQNNGGDSGAGAAVASETVSVYGVEVNLLAFICELASDETMGDRLVEAGVLDKLFAMRDGSVFADVRQNARYGLAALGYTDSDPTPAFRSAVVQLLDVMETTRGRVHLAIRVTARDQAQKGMDTKDGGDGAVKGGSRQAEPDLAVVLTWLIDHRTPSVLEAMNTASKGASRKPKGNHLTAKGSDTGGAERKIGLNGKAKRFPPVATMIPQPPGAMMVNVPLIIVPPAEDTAALQAEQRRERKSSRPPPRKSSRPPPRNDEGLEVKSPTLFPPLPDSVAIEAEMRSMGFSANHARMAATRHTTVAAAANWCLMRSSETIKQWLERNDGEEFVSEFIKQGIDIPTLAMLNDVDLERLGVQQLGARKRLLQCIRGEFGDLSGSNGRLGSFDTLADMAGSTAATLVGSPPPIMGQSSSVSSFEVPASPIVPSSLDIAFLQAQPLKFSETHGADSKLELVEERICLRDSLHEAGRALNVRFGVATADSLLKVVTKKTRVLHISGHGDPDDLVLEDGVGGIERLSAERLQKMLITGGNELQFVFISACFSLTAARAFVDAGVPHVVAVHGSTKIIDASGRAFARHVYISLCQGDSVQQAFQKGCAGVIASEKETAVKPCCCAHLHAASCMACSVCRTPLCCVSHGAPCHSTIDGAGTCCQPHVPHDDSLKFLLLPEGGNHNVRLFDKVAAGPWVNCSPPCVPNNVPSVPGHFKGRADDVLNIVQLLCEGGLKKRIISVTGKKGIGKSSAALAAARYLLERAHFWDGVFWLRLDKRAASVAGVIRAIMEAIPQLRSQMVGTRGSRNAESMLFVNQEGKDAALADSSVVDALASSDHFQLICEYLRDRYVLLVFDKWNGETTNPLQDFVVSLLQQCRHVKAIVTGTVPTFLSAGGLSRRLVHIRPLRPLDSLFVFVNRLPREIRVNEYPQIGNVRRLSDLLSIPLLARIAQCGRPLLIEIVADLLSHIGLSKLEAILLSDDKKSENVLRGVIQQYGPPLSDTLMGMLQSARAMLSESLSESLVIGRPFVLDGGNTGAGDQRKSSGSAYSEYGPYTRDAAVRRVSVPAHAPVDE